MFLGTFQTKFSGNKRIILPKKLRIELSSNFVVLTKGLDGCIWGFSEDDWNKQAQEQLSIPLTDERGRSLRRYFFSAAEIVELDHQGRVVLPTALLIYSGITSEILVVGAGDHFEIWHPERWDSVIATVEKNNS